MAPLNSDVMCSKRSRIVSFLVFVFFIASACIPSSGGPSPKDVFVISAESFDEAQILYALDSLSVLLGERVDKKDESWFHDDSPMFPHFDVAFWYPYESSRTYGVALIKWAPGYGKNTDNYYVSVYERESPGLDCYWCKSVLWVLRPFRLDQFVQDYLPLKTCELCGSVESKLQESHIEILASCNNRAGSEYLRDRCGT